MISHSEGLLRRGSSVSKAVVAAGMSVVFVAVLAAAMKLSAAMPLAVFVPTIGLLGIAAMGVLFFAIAGSVPAIIATFVVLLFLTDGNFRVRPEGDLGLDWQGLLKFVIWTATGVVGLPYLWRSGSVGRDPEASLWTAYMLLATLSLFGSPSAVMSSGYLLSMFALFAFSFAVLAKLSDAQILWTMVLTLTVFLVISWIVVNAYPELGEFRDLAPNGGFRMRMNGIAGQAVNLGLVCAIYLGTVFLLGWQGHARWLSLSPLAALGVVTLAASDARTGMIGVGCGIMAVILSRARWALISLALIVALSFTGIDSIEKHAGVLGSYVSRSGDSEELATFTGRTQIWDFTWDKILERPLLGWGYNSSKVVIQQHVGFSDGLVVDTAHNLLLQNLLSVGIIGTLPVFGLFLKFLIDVVRGQSPPFSILFLVMVLVTGVTDPSALGTTPTLVAIIFMLASLWSGARARPPRADRPATSIRRAAVSMPDWVASGSK